MKITGTELAAVRRTAVPRHHKRTSLHMTLRRKGRPIALEEVSALLEIYAEDATQGMLLKPVPNSKGLERCSKRLLELGIVHSATARRLKIKKLRQDYKKIKDYNTGFLHLFQSQIQALFKHFQGAVSSFSSILQLL